MNPAPADPAQVALPRPERGPSQRLPALVAVGLWVVLALWDPRLAFLILATVAAAVYVVRTVQRPMLGLLVMIPAAALDVVGRLAQVSGVMITLYQVCAVLTTVAVVVAFARGTLRPAGSPMDLPVLLFLGLVVTAIPAAADPRLALVTAASLVSSGLALFLTVWIVRDIEGAWFVLLVLSLVSAVLGLLAVLERENMFAVSGSYFELWRYGTRARVTFGDPNILGAFLAPASLFAMAWAIGERDRARRAVMAACCLAAAAGLFATLSRGAIGGWLIGVLLIVVLCRVSLRWKIGLLAILGGGLFAVAVFVLGPTWVEARIVGVGANASALYRVYMARTALEIFRDYPMGVGPGGYPHVFPFYRDAFVRAGLIESHTAYLTVLVELGFLGLAAFAWLLWRYFGRTVTALRRARDGRVHALALGALAAGTALAAQAFTYSLESTKILWFTFGLGMVAYRLAMGATQSDASKGAHVDGSQ